MRLNLEAFIETLFLTTLLVLNSTRHHLAPPTYPYQSFLLLSLSLNLRGTFPLYPWAWIVQFRTALLDYLSINFILSGHHKTIEVCRGRAQIRQREDEVLVSGIMLWNRTTVKVYRRHSQPLYCNIYNKDFLVCLLPVKKNSFKIVTHRVCVCVCFGVCVCMYVCVYVYIFF